MIDEVIAVSTADAFAMARTGDSRPKGCSPGLPRAGTSSPPWPWRRLGCGHRVVTIQADSGLKYLAGPLFQE